MIGKKKYFNMMFKNLHQFEQNINVLVNNSNDSRLKYPLSFEQISNILGFLTHHTGYQKDIIEILEIIMDS